MYSKLKNKENHINVNLTQENHILLVLMKLRLGIIQKNVEYLFSFLLSNINRTYKRWIRILLEELETLLV